MNSYTNILPFHAWNQSASRSKESSPIKGTRSDGGAFSDLPSSGNFNAYQWKSPGKRSASMAEMVSIDDLLRTLFND